MILTKHLPNFFVIGAVKSGTTSLHRYLSSHPQIFMSPIKEPNFFSQADMKQHLFIRNYRNSVSFDLGKYLKGPMAKNVHIADIQIWSDYIKLFRDVSSEIGIGESSNSYLFCPSTAKNIFTRIPATKIIAVLRNPIDRAWSHYLMSRRLGHTLSTDFMSEFQFDSEQVPSGWGITHNYRALGIYSTQLARYYKLFPASQIKVVLYDDYRRSLEDTLNGIFSFLTVNPNTRPTPRLQLNQAALPRFKRLNYFLSQSGIATRVKRITPPAFVPIADQLLFKRTSVLRPKKEELIFLREIYRDEIGKLSELLGQDLRHWLGE